ncbi:glycosyltransferase family 1 protein [Pseudomonas sp. 21TX0197]|uniref:glycosyltransferase family 4 protein n=1 Tax=unclassified Pseudomonas TaxID=196821 RepID=UPI0009193AFC|nr:MULTISPECIES: glycosyltransferase family 1 protein [unclassified Pseudomonas]MDB6441863.1 glycosyltransferase family 1 protein [Pseudomonas sp. 21TX0197]ROO40639.1 glycosyl transferase [Pseudomonas sp. 7SR1]ROO43196.1 glycosyl transferase [Pseudomonas sp. AF76]SFY15554.1 alpha-1,3-rhamnosyl/mannosyltransferase [Pseudomonas sp. NFACC36]SIS07264.1 alpha-1,3-rhamnosyl/mannosyltransferase [Pseudomonas sp. 7SR1]
MRIALNARILRGPRTGIGHYVAELATALAREPDVQLSLFHGWGWSSELPQATLPGYSRLAPLLRQVPGAYRARRWMEQRRFDQRRCETIDLYHEPSLWPLAFEGPTVMTLHDLTHLRYPETQPPARLREIERRLDHAVQQAQLILTDSQFIADEAQRHFGLPAERLRVAPLGVAARFHPRSPEAVDSVLKAHGLEAGRYFLCVGTLEPRKNLSLALRAHARLPESIRQAFPLFIVGMSGWQHAQLNDELKKAMASGHVCLAGYLPDEQVAHLLAGARALIFPSLYEGFGLPLLEAMASGIPIITTRCSAMPEVAGEAGNYCQPDDPQGMRDAMCRLIEDHSHWQVCREAGLQQAALFTWERCAKVTAHAYRQVLGG